MENEMNNTRTNELLNVEEDRVDQFLQSMYYSRKCQYFYIGLLCACCLLIITTIFDGFKIADSPMFIVVELVLNLTITVDFYFRVRMHGFKLYMQQSVWNKLDFIIVCGCNSLFLLSLAAQVSIGEISEELLLVFWSIAQSLRMLVIARK